MTGLIYTWGLVNSNGLVSSKSSITARDLINIFHRQSSSFVFALASRTILSTLPDSPFLRTPANGSALQTLVLADAIYRLMNIRLLRPAGKSFECEDSASNSHQNEDPGAGALHPSAVKQELAKYLYWTWLICWKSGVL